MTWAVCSPAGLRSPLRRARKRGADLDSPPDPRGGLRGWAPRPALRRAPLTTSLVADRPGGGTSAPEASSGAGQTHRPPPAGAGSVVNRCGGGWSAVADAPSSPRSRGRKAPRRRAASPITTRGHGAPSPPQDLSRFVGLQAPRPQPRLRSSRSPLLALAAQNGVEHVQRALELVDNGLHHDHVHALLRQLLLYRRQQRRDRVSGDVQRAF